MHPYSAHKHANHLISDENENQNRFFIFLVRISLFRRARESQTCVCFKFGFALRLLHYFIFLCFLELLLFQSSSFHCKKNRCGGSLVTIFCVRFAHVESNRKYVFNNARIPADAVSHSLKIQIMQNDCSIHVMRCCTSTA